MTSELKIFFEGALRAVSRSPGKLPPEFELVRRQFLAEYLLGSIGAGAVPLVESGEAQARALGEALAASGLTPGRIVCGPLKRTRRAADIVAGLTGFAGTPEIDERLKEIDYGQRAGTAAELQRLLNRDDAASRRGGAGRPRACAP